MPKSESTIQKEIMLALSQAGCVVWRNESAGAWVGREMHRAGDQVTLCNSRMIQAGLCSGSADLIGIGPGGLFIACEVKTATGRVSKKQEAFLLAVNRAGGLGFVARSADDALRAIATHTN